MTAIKDGAQDIRLRLSLRLPGMEPEPLDIDSLTGLVTGPAPLCGGDQLFFAITSSRADLAAIQVDGRTLDVQLRQDRGKAQRKWRRCVTLRRDSAGEARDREPRLFTLPGVNDIRLIEVTDGNLLVSHEYAVVGQGSEVFVAYNRREVRLYRTDAGALDAPDMRTADGEPWTALMGAIEAAGLAKASELPPISTYQEPAAPSINGLAEGQARVAWYSPTRGMGVAVTPLPNPNGDGLAVEEVSLHWSNLPVVPGVLRALEPGQIVTGVLDAMPAESRSGRPFRNRYQLTQIQNADSLAGQRAAYTALSGAMDGVVITE